jgi:hypothetical protein
MKANVIKFVRINKILAKIFIEIVDANGRLIFEFEGLYESYWISKLFHKKGFKIVNKEGNSIDFGMSLEWELSEEDENTVIEFDYDNKIIA